MRGRADASRGAPALTDREVRLILARAARADARAAFTPGRSVTLPELMDAARQAGLDPEEVRRAAAIRPAAPEGVQVALLGAPLRRHARAAVSGEHPVALNELGAAVQRALPEPGEAAVFADGSRRWIHGAGGTRTTVTLRPTEGGAEMEVEVDRAAGYAVGCFTALAGLLAAAAPLGGLAALYAALPPLVATLALVAAPFLILRPLLHRADQRSRAAVEDLMMALLRAAEGAGYRATSYLGELPPGSRGAPADSDGSANR